MEDDKLERAIADVLPNIPEEVCQNWLLKVARNEGWPPNGDTWDKVLLERDLGFWGKTEWSQEKVDLGKVRWDPDTDWLLSRMSDGLLNDSTSLFGDQHNDRIISIMKYLFETGTLPGQISLLSLDVPLPNGYRWFALADGHHRISALKWARKIMSDIGNLSTLEADHVVDKIEKEWGIRPQSAISDYHNGWVARHQG